MLIGRKNVIEQTIGAIVAALMLSGCGKSESDLLLASNPKQAASQLERAFASAPAATKQNAELASAAMRSGDYEKAVVSLQSIRSGQGLTLEQGLAIHSSMVSLEEKLVRAMDAGDPNARRAYELLKQLKRK